jgi:hypothetical protein
LVYIDTLRCFPILQVLGDEAVSRVFVVVAEMTLLIQFGSASFQFANMWAGGPVRQAGRADWCEAEPPNLQAVPSRRPLMDSVCLDSPRLRSTRLLEEL